MAALCETLTHTAYVSSVARSDRSRLLDTYSVLITEGTLVSRIDLEDILL